MRLRPAFWVASGWRIRAIAGFVARRRRCDGRRRSAHTSETIPACPVGGSSRVVATHPGLGRQARRTGCGGGWLLMRWPGRKYCGIDTGEVICARIVEIASAKYACCDHFARRQVRREVGPIGVSYCHLPLSMLLSSTRHRGRSSASDRGRRVVRVRRCCDVRCRCERCGYLPSRPGVRACPRGSSYTR